MYKPILAITGTLLLIKATMIIHKLFTKTRKNNSLYNVSPIKTLVEVIESGVKSKKSESQKDKKKRRKKNKK